MLQPHRFLYYDRPLATKKLFKILVDLGMTEDQVKDWLHKYPVVNGWFEIVHSNPDSAKECPLQACEDRYKILLRRRELEEGLAKGRSYHRSPMESLLFI